MGLWEGHDNYVVSLRGKQFKKKKKHKAHMVVSYILTGAKYGCFKLPCSHTSCIIGRSLSTHQLDYALKENPIELPSAMLLMRFIYTIQGHLKPMISLARNTQTCASRRCREDWQITWHPMLVSTVLLVRFMHTILGHDLFIDPLPTNDTDASWSLHKLMVIYMGDSILGAILQYMVSASFSCFLYGR